MSLSGTSLARALIRPTNPPILPIPSRRAGNNVPKSLHKTRRGWKPNTTRADWPISLLETALRSTTLSYPAPIYLGRTTPTTPMIAANESKSIQSPLHSVRMITDGRTQDHGIVPVKETSRKVENVRKDEEKGLIVKSESGEDKRVAEKQENLDIGHVVRDEMKVKEGRMNMLKGVKMQTRRLKDVEKAGGLEGLLLSRPSKHFTPFGRRLRYKLFQELERIADSRRIPIPVTPDITN
ncbi:hypothetical protein M231_01585 [Tremella mesenterica]|uniref:Uncharacterized protein n=1 Tax=Tremella mesenterica TaxID=5217 RepID=A0A4Q1BT73_TREME|nr:hypothetical protein M231_01585 [Tremella mesenterica]